MMKVGGNTDKNEGKYEFNMFWIYICDGGALLPCNMCDGKQNEDIHEHEQRKVLNIEGPDYGPEDKADTEGTVGITERKF